jgi:hypothetical protein
MPRALVGIGLQGLGREEMEIALNLHPARPSDRHNFREADAPEFGKAHAEIAKPERGILILGIKVRSAARLPRPRGKRRALGG